VILYRTADGLIVVEDNKAYVVEESLDALVAREDLHAFMEQRIRAAKTAGSPDAAKLLAPIGSQEVWAAGVTYLRSRAARMAESKDAGGGDFYDRVYAAERPELFFKSLAYKVVGPGGAVGLRSDATWSVPEPELALLINPAGSIIGYTIGNDMSSRDIEGQNPQLRARSGNSDHATAARRRHADLHCDCPRRRIGFCRRNHAGADEAPAAGTG
jgi:2-dehydro-3-deoxy-D-arabinonate dehydratase